MEFAEELWEVVQEHKEHSESSLVQNLDRFVKFCAAKVWLQVPASTPVNTHCKHASLSKT